MTDSDPPDPTELAAYQPTIVGARAFADEATHLADMDDAVSTAETIASLREWLIGAVDWIRQLADQLEEGTSHPN